MTDNERAARCAWLVYLNTLLDMHWGDEVRATSGAATCALGALPRGSEGRAAHLVWRREVSKALEETLQRFCPGGDSTCCDKRFWPEEERSDGEDWVEIGKRCSAGRRSMWLRLVLRSGPDGIVVEAIELKAGREGRDAAARITRDNPQFVELLALFTTARFGATTGRKRTMAANNESWEHFIEDAEKLLGDLDDLPERAAGFADGVRERLEGMIEWARENDHATEKMWGALYNMQNGVAKWQQ